MENAALRQYLEYSDSEDEFTYRLRMELEWDDTAYLTMVRLLTNVLAEYRHSLFIPKPVVYFLSNGVRQIIGLVSNNLFYLNPPAPFTEETYRALIDKRISELLQVQQDFFAGTI
jgi:hypothetical protein